MSLKTFYLPALSILCITILAVIGLMRAYDPTITYLCVVAIAGLGGYSVRTAAKNHVGEYPP